jgi:hypothetical protein
VTILRQFSRALARIGRWLGSVVTFHGATRLGPRRTIANSIRAQFLPEEFVVRGREESDWPKA